MAQKQLVNFVVEIRDPRTGFWLPLLPIAPQYKYEDRIVKRHFFSRKKKVRFIINLKKASLGARRRAISHGKAYYNRKHEVQIKEHSIDGRGYLQISTIWENGEFLDC